MTTLTGPAPTIQRDRWGRPLIVPPGGGEPVAYTRATTVAGTLDDLNGLMLWKQRMTAIGLIERPTLQAQVAEHRDDKQRLNRILRDAMDAAHASAAADTGTMLHGFAERLDKGETPEGVPPEHQADLEAYKATTAALEPLHIEELGVVDDLKIAGTPDRVVRYHGETYIADLKTGSITYPGKIAAQLAVYAHAQRYDQNTGQRHPWDGSPVNQNRALIIHLPAGVGVCSLHWVDIAKGWEAVHLAMQVRDWRRQERTLTNIIHEPVKTQADLLLEAIQDAATVDALTDLWSKHHALWTPLHTEAAAARKKSLAQAPAA